MLVGARLTLCPLTAPDARRLLAGPGALDFVDGYPSTFATEVLRLVAEFPGEPVEPVEPLGPWLITRRPDYVVVGLMSCTSTADALAVTVGYEVAGSCEGQGYATEALQALVEHLLGLPEVSRVYADTTVGHAASRRVMEKAGLRWQRDQVECLDGRDVAFAHYASDRAAIDRPAGD